MRRFGIITVLLFTPWIGTASARAEKPTFPYAATVQTDGAEVRSGPGQNYYTTSKLRRNQSVQVHRHDPGGWWMIAPPEGSFSWIVADAVRVNGRHATVEAPQIDVQIGSELSDSHEFSGVTLTQGDEIQVLEETVLNTSRGQQRFLKIVPPAYEYRWIKGEALTGPAGDGAETKSGRRRWNAGNSSSAAASSKSGSSKNVHKADLTLPSLPTSEAADPGSADTGKLRAQEKQLDAEVAAMLEQDPSKWRLNEAEQEYHRLQSVATPVVSAEIDRRRANLAGKRRLYDEMSNFIQLTSATNERDQALVNRQAAVMTAGVPQVQLGQPAPLPFNPSRPLTPAPVAPKLVTPVNGQLTMASPQSPVMPGKEPTISGAGIVRRNPIQVAGAPPYVLTSADGRVLAALESVGPINLETVVGRSVGVSGVRAFDPRLRSDLIRVERAMPVQLK